METTSKAVLQEILCREDDCNYVTAAALRGVQPTEILARFSFDEFSQLVARIKTQSAPVDDFTKEST